MQVASTTSDPAYRLFEEHIARTVACLEGPLFTTDATGLFALYLEQLPRDRQHYNCRACQRFIEAYGPLAHIDAQGARRSALWQDAASVPEFFRPAVLALADRVARARLTGVFINEASAWGKARTRTVQGQEWTHLAGAPEKLPQHASKLKTAAQVMAEKHQDHGLLAAALAEFPVEAVRQAVRVLEADALSRSEKALGVARWLLALHEAIGGSKGPVRDALLWRATATAPPGWCHVRSTLIGTLLEDIVAGLPYETIAQRWAKKAHPLQYQRPSAPPSEGAITQANKIIAALEAEGALSRRFARDHEVVAFWRPAPPVASREAENTGGVFDHLRTRGAPVKALDLPGVAITWEKFVREVLPGARTLELRAPSWGNYCGLVSAANADAPPLLQWDTEPRNRVSWFVFVGGSAASRWGLTPGAWVKVSAVCAKPPHWHHPDQFAHQGHGAILVLGQARFQGEARSGGLFPEMLRTELHPVRAVLEAHARRSVIAGQEEGDANGYLLQKGRIGELLRVNGERTYIVDRWE